MKLAFALLLKIVFTVSVFSSFAHADSAKLQKIFMRLSGSGGGTEPLGSNELNSTLHYYERLNLRSPTAMRSSIKSAQQTEASTLRALQHAGASPYMTFAHCYNPNELNYLFHQRIKNQYVVQNQRAFDPYRKVGFCFGRALVAHTQSVAYKPTVPVVKVWATGIMTRGSLRWDYHVTTAVLGCDRNWYTMDTIYSTPMPVQRWIHSMKVNYSAAPNTLFTVTRALRFGPEANHYYSNANLADFIYNGYFDHYLNTNRYLIR